MCARILQSKNVWKEKLKEKQKLEKSVKRKENEKHAKKRIGKQKKTRTKKLGTNGLEKKRSKWTTQVENMSSIHMCNCEHEHLEVWNLWN